MIVNAECIERSALVVTCDISILVDVLEPASNQAISVVFPNTHFLSFAGIINILLTNFSATEVAAEVNELCIFFVWIVRMAFRHQIFIELNVVISRGISCKVAMVVWCNFFSNEAAMEILPVITSLILDNLTSF